jgi:hypothetical protein
MNELLSQAYARATTNNYLYNRHRLRWQFLLNSYVGGEEYRKGAYLNRYQLESDKDYARRLEQTPLDNQCKSIISLYNSFLFRKNPEREFSTMEYDPRVENILEDADLDGRDINGFMREVAVWSQVFGHCWVAVSKPNVDATTLADELAMNVRPFLSVLTPLAVIDWKWRREINGSFVLEMIRYVEEINDTEQTVKEWTEDEIITTIINTNQNEATDIQIEVNELSMLPFVLVYAERSPVRGIGLSVIDDIADQQKMMYNESSEIYESIRLDTHPSLAATQDTDIGSGAGSLIRLPDHLDPNLKPYILEFSGAPIDKIYTSINERKKMIDGMANVGSVRATEIREQSGVAIATEFALLNARLCLLASNLNLAEEQIWQWVGIYIGIPWAGEISYPSSFEMRDTDRELTQLVTAHNTVQDPLSRAAIEREILDLVDVEPQVHEQIEMLNREQPAEQGYPVHIMYHPETLDELEIKTQAQHDAAIQAGYVELPE